MCSSAGASEVHLVCLQQVLSQDLPDPTPQPGGQSHSSTKGGNEVPGCPRCYSTTWHRSSVSLSFNRWHNQVQGLDPPPPEVHQARAGILGSTFCPHRWHWQRWSKNLGSARKLNCPGTKPTKVDQNLCMLSLNMMTACQNRIRYDQVPPNIIPKMSRTQQQ